MKDLHSIHLGRYSVIDKKGGWIMLDTLKIDLKPAEIIRAIKRMKKKERDTFLEDLLAATSPEYLDSIRKARADYKAGRVKTHEEVFGK
ncbi:hypothetical protein S225a_10790 [Candidatus Brocadiaceae bacterium S225]|uniref:Uncharacterized protein n=1 Tax=Candidatus Scalindua brodae TaxID=237368 RepID=A0A0B0ELH9_9BACT|nr:MAG: hypothetical protein SCABRO_02690 [Candidatus Scalindua brodae]TWU34721.1 hypothetical protein S225a_10790 [Candidatus Brocadiaceae bacterium S225]